MECTVSWTGATGSRSGMGFLAETGTGHSIQMDGAVEAGGANLGARPMEMLLAGAGGCTAFDVVMILKRGRQAVTGCTVAIKGERAETDPKVFTKIHFQFRVTGKNLDATAVQRAVQLSHDKYCSATIMLGKTAEITTGVDVVEA